MGVAQQTEIDFLRHAFQADLQNRDAARALAGVLRTVNGWQEAQQIYQQALNHHPGDRDLLLGYGRVTFDLYDLNEACRAFDLLISLFPRDAEILINAGKIYKNAGHYEKAENAYRAVLTTDDIPQRVLAAFNYSQLLLAQKRWQAGFAAYETRLALPRVIPTPWGLPVWRQDLPPGSSVLVWSDQGLGDAIMFARFIPILRDKGYRLSLLVQDPLHDLMRGIEGVDKIYRPTDMPVPHDAALALGSLPFALSVDLDAMNGDAYLNAPEARINLPPRQGRKRVGLMWAGNSNHSNDRNRSLNFDALAPLLTNDAIEFFGLQKNNFVPPAYAGCVQDLAPHLTDLAATASIIDQLDLIICVDTSIAHLAGALGKECWVMLPAIDCDWRWGLSGEHSLWYKSLRLFRQTRPGDWSPVIDAIKEKLVKDVF